MIVNRTIDGSTKRFVEQLQDRDWGSDQDDAWFVDSGLSWGGGDAVNITLATQANPCTITVSSWPTDADGDDMADGDNIYITGITGMTDLNGNYYTVDDADSTALTLTLDDSASVGNIDSTGFSAYVSGGTVQIYEKDFTVSHLEGETLSVWADGVIYPDVTVSSNAIELSDWVNTAIVGLPYTSIVECMPIDIPLQSGSSAAKLKQIITVYIDFYETLTASYGKDADTLTHVSFTGDATTLQSDWQVLSWDHGMARKATLYITTSQPGPLTVRQFSVDVEVRP
jgi:hypothetical protein